MQRLNVDSQEWVKTTFLPTYVALGWFRCPRICGSPVTYSIFISLNVFQLLRKPGRRTGLRREEPGTIYTCETFKAPYVTDGRVPRNGQASGHQTMWTHISIKLWHSAICVSIFWPWQLGQGRASIFSRFSLGPVDFQLAFTLSTVIFLTGFLLKVPYGLVYRERDWAYVLLCTFDFSIILINT